MKYPLQIIPNDDIHAYAKNDYPNLYNEVMQHDKTCGSSWYDLSETAYKEYEQFRLLMSEKGLWELNAHGEFRPFESLTKGSNL